MPAHIERHRSTPTSSPSTSGRSTRPRTACCGSCSSSTARRSSRCIPHIGYLHCGFEKIGEYRTYNQIIPYTDRMDYLSPLGNNVGFALAVEKLLGIEIPPRCQVLRVHRAASWRASSRTSSGSARTCIDLGALTPFLWTFQERERHLQPARGPDRARASRRRYTRVGGMAADIPDGLARAACASSSTPSRRRSTSSRRCSRKNAIWVGRTQGVGVISPAEAHRTTA